MSRATLRGALLVLALGLAPSTAVGQVAEQDEVMGAWAAPRSPGVTDASVRRALARYRHEPSVDRVVEAARRARTADPGRVRDAMDRARATGWLPTVRASVRRGQTVDLRGLGVGAVDEVTNVSTDDALTFEASMTFRFDRVAFAPEEPALLRELRAVELERDRIAATVVQLYFERRRLQLERDLGADPDPERAVRIVEIEALLDALSGGAFTRIMGRSTPPAEDP